MYDSVFFLWKLLPVSLHIKKQTKTQQTQTPKNPKSKTKQTPTKQEKEKKPPSITT